MPIDRNNTNTARPLKPTLATTRTAKTPVAPRLAPSVASASNASNTTATRTPRPRSAVGSTPRINVTPREDLTPAKPFIASNVTPRSSARKSRVGVGSANSTPSTTPSVTPTAPRPASTIEPPRELGLGYGVKRPTSAQGKRPRSVVGGGNHSAAPTPRLPLSNIYTSAPDTGAREPASPMFFHANSARPQQEQQPPPKKGPVFFYANGEQDESSRAPEVPSPPLSSLGRPQSDTKFFHADSISEAKGNPLPILTPPPITTSPEPWASLNHSQSDNSLRPLEPTKDHVHLSYRKGVSQVLRPSLHRGNSSALSILSGNHTPEPSVVSSRKSSATSATVRFSNHTKSASLSSIDSTNSLKKVPSHELPSIVPSPLHNEKRIVSDGSIPESIASSPDPTTAFSGLPSPSIISKPAPGQSVLEHMNELAANARRERKVLDLEISNSSMQAINRSLEREVRKQKAELRRFRRMSRAGRFSANTTPNLEDFSAIGTSELGDLSDMSEEDDPEPEDSSDSSFDESTMSLSALAERDAAHRERDEKRLQLDLSKHRELLVDSQKMNESLGRCLTWTEELIKDAQKALSYQVRVSDVRLGGRVLISEEEEADVYDEGDSKGLLSPWTPPHRSSEPDSSPFSTLEGRERDSGVDLDGIKSIPMGVISPLGSPLG